MASPTLGQALEIEHREIDGGIEQFVAVLDAGGTPVDTAPLTAALSGLRRHIYLEEEFLFPPLKAAGLMGPIFVMLREHGMIWRQMDTVESLIPAAGTAAVRQACLDLLSLLDDHNAKEEPIIYTQADEILGAEAGSGLLAFLENGTTPDGWVASAA